MVRFTHGLVKKVVIADSAGAIADAIFALPEGDLTAGASWLAVVAYTVQIYFDFSGYSDMAIGIGKMLGFNFPENFNRPYAALSVTDFWRRWHMTLSNWFRDYVYITLGGSRGGPVRTYINSWTVFVLTGVWHGANWTFLIWGLYHGALLVVERALGLREAKSDLRGGAAEYVARRVAVFLLVMIGWVFFRSPDLGFAASMLAGMFSFADMAVPASAAVGLNGSDVFFMAVGVVIAVAPPASWRGPNAYEGAYGRIVQALLLLAAFPYALVKVTSGTYSPFLYFQF